MTHFDSLDNRMRYVKLKKCWRKISASNSLFLLLSIILLWLVLLEMCLLGSKEFCNLDKVYVGSEKRDYNHVPFRLYQEKTAESCLLFTLNYGSNSFYHMNRGNNLCLRTPPYPDSCGIAEQLFFSEPASSCAHQLEYKFCYLEKPKFRSRIVKCNATQAAACANSSLSLGLPNLESGNLEWETYSNTLLLADKLTSLLNRPDVKHYGFAFIKCSVQESAQVTEYIISMNQEYDYPSYSLYEDKSMYKEQLLILPPSVSVKKNTRDQDGSDINVNIILVDSTSRQHFFRSLKRSVSVLESMTTDPNATSYVFDFELMQAVKSRTFETLQTIFSGYVNITETPFATHGMPTKPLNLVPIFKKFQEKSYKTLWLEDLCYLWEWGISKDLHFLNLSRDPSDTWKLMWKRLHDNGVDDIDITISMCRLLAANNMKDPFRHTDSICFNRKHQHEYLFEYLKAYQLEVLSVKQPFLTVTSVNVGHEETGRRIQTLDKDLADYISFVTSLDNTLSIIFSDHGNAYGQFFSYSQEARVELFHPFMFFIIPKKVASTFNPAVLSALQVNTKRLVSALDLHYTLLFLANDQLEDIIVNKDFPVSKKGLFEPVNPTRTCDSVPRIPPNLCICNSEEQPVQSSSFQALFAYHAVGAINAEIQRQFISGVTDITSVGTASGNCQALELHEVSNIRENRGSDGVWKISMDVHVQESQVFFVALIVKAVTEDRHAVSLETVSRISKYGPFEQCADASVELSLCICNISTSRQKLSHSSHSKLLTEDHYANIPVIPGFKNSMDFVSGSDKCLLIFSAIHNQGMAVFVANICEKAYLFNLEVQADIRYVYFFHSSNILLLSGSFVYFALIINENQEGLSYPLHSQFREVNNWKKYLPLSAR